MQKEYFSVAFLGSVVLHIAVIAVLHFTTLDAKQIAVQTQPIAISLYEEPKKEELPKPETKKIEKKQKIVQKQQEPAPKTLPAEPIKTAQTPPLPQASSEPPAPKPTPQVTAKSQNSDEVKKYLSQIRKTLQDNLEYPHFARKAGIEGIATVHFCIKADGGMPRQSLKILKSSGSTALDKQALETVQLSTPFTPPPKGEIEVSIPVSFSLNG